MDVYALLKRDHRKVRSIFGELEGTTARAGKKRETLFAALNEDLTLHALAEEALFYPRVLKPRPSHDMTLEALEEHKVMKTLLAELENDAKGTEEWGAKVKVLKEIVEHHVEEEETEIFKNAKNAISKEESESLAREIEAFKEEARKDEPQLARR